MTMTKLSTHKLLAGGLCGLMVLAAAPATWASAPRAVEFAPTSKIWIEGDSTVHAYKSTTQRFDATLAMDESGRYNDLKVVIPVKGLKSGEGGLDDNMYKALKTDKFASIRFTSNAGSFTVAKSGAVDVVAKGKLMIAGQEREVAVKASGTLVGDTLKLKGKTPLKMSDFGVQPPVLLGGMIKCSDEITIHYDLVGKLKP